MMLVFWLGVLLASVWAAHWGADQLAEPLQKLRQQQGLSEAAGATVVALATASPEIGTNAVSAIQGVSDIGLGNLLDLWWSGFYNSEQRTILSLCPISCPINTFDLSGLLNERSH